MSSLQVGIVGLPNVGKSTLFNALLKKQAAYSANFPFATIEPNIGVIPVPDVRLEQLAKIVKESENLEKLPPEVPATVEFLDIAGLVAGAHKGEGLGNKFLSHIRNTDVICHVVRAFDSPEIIREGSTNPKSDLETIEMELMLADFGTLEKQRDPGNTPDLELKKRWSVVEKFMQALEKSIPARDVELVNEEKRYAKELSLLTAKKILVVVNIDETDLPKAEGLEEQYAKEFNLPQTQVIAVSAKIESELAGLDVGDQKTYLKELGVEKTGLERVIKKAFATLGLITFLTAGEKEVRAWTIKGGIDAQEAAGVIHTDFFKKFIKADVVSFNDFVSVGGLASPKLDVGGLASPKRSVGGWKNARDVGKVRSEGREYLMRDGDVVEFKIGA